MSQSIFFNSQPSLKRDFGLCFDFQGDQESRICLLLLLGLLYYLTAKCNKPTLE